MSCAVLRFACLMRSGSGTRLPSIIPFNRNRNIDIVEGDQLSSPPEHRVCVYMPRYAGSNGFDHPSGKRGFPALLPELSELSTPVGHVNLQEPEHGVFVVAEPANNHGGQARPWVVNDLEGDRLQSAPSEGESCHMRHTVNMRRAIISLPPLVQRAKRAI
jgi:hypothetical protein